VLLLLLVPGRKDQVQLFGESNLQLVALLEIYHFQCEAGIRQGQLYWSGFYEGN
jgi:hypothetical protein